MFKGKSTKETPNTEGNSVIAHYVRLELFTMLTHFFFPWGNSRIYNTAYLELHICSSQAKTQLAEALGNKEAQKRNLF